MEGEESVFLGFSLVLIFRLTLWEQGTVGQGTSFSTWLFVKNKIFSTLDNTRGEDANFHYKILFYSSCVSQLWTLVTWMTDISTKDVTVYLVSLSCIWLSDHCFNGPIQYLEFANNLLIVLGELLDMATPLMSLLNGYCPIYCILQIKFHEVRNIKCLFLYLSSPCQTVILDLLVRFWRVVQPLTILQAPPF